VFAWIITVKVGVFVRFRACFIERDQTFMMTDVDEKMNLPYFDAIT
jgi:hypothetical protein